MQPNALMPHHRHFTKTTNYPAQSYNFTLLIVIRNGLTGFEYYIAHLFIDESTVTEYSYCIHGR